MQSFRSHEDLYRMTKTTSTLRALQALSLFLLPLISQAQILYFPRFNLLELSEMKSTAALLTEACRPPKCLLIFPGRSFSPVPPYLESKGVHNHILFPLSGMRYVSLERFSTYESNRTEDPHLKSLRENFEEKVLNAFFGKSYFEQFSEVKVVDFMGCGSSIAITSLWLRKYLPENMEIEILGYQDYSRGNNEPFGSVLQKVLQDNRIGHRYITASNPDWKPGERIGFGYAMNMGDFDNFAPFGSWTPYQSNGLKTDIDRPPTDKRPTIDFSRRNERESLIKQFFASYQEQVEWFRAADFEQKVQEWTCNQALSRISYFKPDGFFRKDLK